MGGSYEAGVGSAAIVLGWHRSQFVIFQGHSSAQAPAMVSQDLGFTPAVLLARPSISSELRAKYFEFLSQFRDLFDQTSIPTLTCVAPQDVGDIENFQWFKETLFDTLHIPIELRSTEQEVSALIRHNGLLAKAVPHAIGIGHISGAGVSAWELTEAGLQLKSLTASRFLVPFKGARRSSMAKRIDEWKQAELRTFTEWLSKGEVQQLVWVGEDLEILGDELGKSWLDPLVGCSLWSQLKGVADNQSFLHALGPVAQATFHLLHGLTNEFPETEFLAPRTSYLGALSGLSHP